MKNLILIVALCVSVAAFSQSTSPRFGTLKNQDNTYRVLTLKKAAIVDAAGNDTLSVSPNAFRTYVTCTAVDSFSVRVGSVATSYFGDNLQLIVSGTTGKIVKFVGANILANGNATLSTNGRVIVTFVFDGAKWVEAARVAQ
jgi:hypothetical protein